MSELTPNSQIGLMISDSCIASASQDNSSWLGEGIGPAGKREGSNTFVIPSCFDVKQSVDILQEHVACTQQHSRYVLLQVMSLC